MRYETFGFILVGFLVFISIIGTIIILRSKAKEHIGEKIWRFCGAGIMAILSLILFSYNSMNDYSLNSEMDEWAKYRTPQIDSSMFLDTGYGNKLEYSSLSKHAIRHLSKTVTYDLWFLDRIDDEFQNKNQNSLLQMSFIKANLFRKKKRIDVLKKRQDFDYTVSDTLTVPQADSILKSWGFTDELYKVKRRW